uniref:Uncharacterized protein n=1 Tax=Plectus sambesii TaxID=2011161 RepID=A0A914X8P5_9BILA
MVLRREPLEQETSFTEIAGEDNNEVVVDEEEDEDDQRIYYHIYDYEADAFSSLTTYHGLVRIYNARSWPSRIFWIVTVLFWLTLFVIHSGTLLWAFNQHSTEVVITTVVPENGIQFPALTVCNLNPVMRSKVAGWNMSDAVLNYLLKLYPEVGKLEPFATRKRYLAREHDEYLKYTEEFKSNTGREFELGAFFSETGHTCEDMVLSCKWGRKKLPNCCDYAVPVTTDLGQCFSFTNFNHSAGGQRQKISGASYGFHIVMDVKTEERNDAIQLAYMDAGIRLFVHPQNTLPYLHTDGVAAAPGTKVYGSLKLRNISLLSKEEWGSCLNKWDEDVHGVQIVDRNYSSAHCEANCVANIFWNKCNCVPLSQQFNSQMRVCTPFELRNCSNDDYLRATPNEIPEEIYSNCGCRMECNRLVYKIAAQYSALTMTHPHLHTHFGVSRSYVRDNLVAADVFMEEIVYEEYEQSPRSRRVDVLSKIGGSVGLFLGVSVITLFEILTFLFKSAWGAVSIERQKRFERKEQKIYETQLDALEKRILPADDISVIVENAADDDDFIEERSSWSLARRASEIPRGSRRVSQYIDRPRTASDHKKPSIDNDDIYMEQPSTSRRTDGFEDVEFAIENHQTNKPPAAPAITVDEPIAEEAHKPQDGRGVHRVRSNEGTRGNPMVRRQSRFLIRQASLSPASGANPSRRQSLRTLVLQQGRARHLSEHESAAASVSTRAAAGQLESGSQRRSSTTFAIRLPSSVPRTRHISESDAVRDTDRVESGRKASIQSTQSALSKNSDIVLTIIEHRRPSVAAWSRADQIQHLRRPLRPLLRRPARSMVVERRSSVALPTIVLRAEESDDEEARDSPMPSQLRRSLSERRPSRTPSAASGNQGSNREIQLSVVSDNRRLSIAPSSAATARRLSVAPSSAAMGRRPTRGQLLLRRPSRTVVIEHRRNSMLPASLSTAVDNGSTIQQDSLNYDRQPSNIHLAVVHEQRRSSIGSGEIGRLNRQRNRLVPAARSPSRLSTEPQPSTSAQYEPTSSVGTLHENDSD